MEVQEQHLLQATLHHLQPYTCTPGPEVSSHKTIIHQLARHTWPRHTSKDTLLQVPNLQHPSRDQHLLQANCTASYTPPALQTQG